MKEPSLRDIDIDANELALDVLLPMLFEVEYMILQTTQESELMVSPEDIAALYTRKSHLLCMLQRHDDAVHFAQLSIDLIPSMTAYFRLGCAQYCCHRFEAASAALMSAQALDPMSRGIKHALKMLSLRVNSRKDRQAFL